MVIIQSTETSTTLLFDKLQAIALTKLTDLAAKHGTLVEAIGAEMEIDAQDIRPLIEQFVASMSLFFGIDRIPASQPTPETIH